MDAQELLCPQHCFMEWFCNASLVAKRRASAMFLLLRFLFGSLAWYARFPLPCYKSVLRKSILYLFAPLRPFKIMFWNWNPRSNYLIEKNYSGVIIHPSGVYTIMMYSGPFRNYSAKRVSQKITLVGFYGGEGVGVVFLFKKRNAKLCKNYCSSVVVTGANVWTLSWCHKLARHNHHSWLEWTPGATGAQRCPLQVWAKQTSCTKM